MKFQRVKLWQKKYVAKVRVRRQGTRAFIIRRMWPERVTNQDQPHKDIRKIMIQFFRMHSNQNGNLKLKKKMLKKLCNWVTWIFKNDLGKSKKRIESQEDVHYFEATGFYNDLDNPKDYYLKVVPGGDNEFVRKDEVDDN